MINQEIPSEWRRCTPESSPPRSCARGRGSQAEFRITKTLQWHQILMSQGQQTANLAPLLASALDVLPQRCDRHSLTGVAYGSPRERGPCQVNSPTLGAQKPFVYPVVAASVPESPLRSSFCPRGLGEDSPEAARSRTRKEKPRHRGPCGHVPVARPRAASPQGAHLRGRLSPSLSYPKFLQNFAAADLLAGSLPGLARWQPAPQPSGALLLPVAQKSHSHPAWRARGARDAFASRDGGGEVLIPSGIPQGSSPAESLAPIF